MTVVICYTTGTSKLFMDVSSIENTGDLIQVSYPSGTDIIPKCCVRDIRVALD